jgi:hypothetical protein
LRFDFKPYRRDCQDCKECSRSSSSAPPGISSGIFSRYRQAEPRATSALDGSFAFWNGIPGQKSIITVEAQRFASGRRTVEVSPDSGLLQICLAGGRTLTRIVVDEDGQPLADAEVRASIHWSWRSKTGPDGRLIQAADSNAGSCESHLRCVVPEIPSGYTNEPLELGGRVLTAAAVERGSVGDFIRIDARIGCGN